MLQSGNLSVYVTRHKRNGHNRYAEFYKGNTIPSLHLRCLAFLTPVTRLEDACVSESLRLKPEKQTN